MVDTDADPGKTIQLQLGMTKFRAPGVRIGYEISLGR